MDARIEEAFLRVWFELITDKDKNLLPLEPSVF